MANWTKQFQSNGVTVSVSDKAAVMVTGAGKTCCMLDSQFLAIATLPRETLAEIVDYVIASQAGKQDAKEQAKLQKQIEKLQAKNAELKAAIEAKQAGKVILVKKQA